MRKVKFIHTLFSIANRFTQYWTFDSKAPRGCEKYNSRVGIRHKIHFRMLNVRILYVWLNHKILSGADVDPLQDKIPTQQRTVLLTDNRFCAVILKTFQLTGFTFTLLCLLFITAHVVLS